MSGNRPDFGYSDGTSWKHGKSTFAVLAESQEEDLPDLDVLKQRIRSVSGGSLIGGHAKAHIKL